MYLCYIDESGTSTVPGNTSHFILAGLSVPIWHWNDSDRELGRLRARYGIPDAELHTAWMLRQYPEQNRVPNFDALPHVQRRVQVTALRNAELLRVQRLQNRNQYRQLRKNYAHTNDYIHLTFTERRQFVLDVAQTVGNWGFARLFAECIDKVHFDPTRTNRSIDEQSFEQIISRFEQYLAAVTTDPAKRAYGLLVHDNNETVARRHTDMMKHFHRHGTFWTHISHIIETPLFVDSQLTGLVQVADLCAYALRRYLENQETELFNEIFKRADRRQGVAVGVRHYADNSPANACQCTICQQHRPITF